MRQSTTLKQSSEGYIDPRISEEVALDAAVEPTITEELERITLSGDIREMSIVSREPHTLIFPAPISVNAGQLVATGQIAVVDLTTPAAGDYAFLCNVHQGMTGILRVE